MRRLEPFRPGSESTLCAQLLVFVLVALVAGIFTYELAAVQPNWYGSQYVVLLLGHGFLWYAR
jgi:hypothetical protein